MDLLIRFWVETDNDVKEIFWLKFFRHAVAKDLSKQFKEITKALVSTKIFQASMGESNINLTSYEVWKQECNENLFLSLVDIDTCSLHSVHGAIRSRLETTFWGIKETLTGAFQLLHDSPARHEGFEVVTSSNKYPLFFCATRCVESKVVADRLLEIWINMQDIEFWNKFPKYKQPTCKSFDNVKSVTDPLSEAKICFSFISFLVEPYLKKNQADKPMVSFIYTELKSLLRNLPSNLWSLMFLINVSWSTNYFNWFGSERKSFAFKWCQIGFLS